MLKQTIRDTVDTSTTTKMYGFTTCGMTIKDHYTGSVITKIEKNKKPKDLDEAEELLEHFFRFEGGHDC